MLPLSLTLGINGAFNFKAVNLVERIGDGVGADLQVAAYSIAGECLIFIPVQCVIGNLIFICGPQIQLLEDGVVMGG